MSGARPVAMKAERTVVLVLWLAAVAGCTPAPSPPPRVEPLPTMRPTRPGPTATPPPPIEEQPLAETPPGSPVPTETPAPGVTAAEAPTAARGTAVPAEPESLLAHITATTPPNVAAAIRLIEEGREQMRHGRFDQALDRLERAVAIDPSNAYGYYFLALLHYRNKDYGQAIGFANRAVVLGARSADRVWLGRIYSLQGAVYEEVGRFPDARAAYEKAVHADPSNLAAQVGIGRLSGAQP